MLQQPEELRTSSAVRDGQLVPVTCATCGCRLTAESGDGSWHHYGSLGGRDARGHRTACVELAHDTSGRVAVPA